MKGEEIEIGKGGIKFSYHRFVSDSSLGFVFILMFLPKILTLCYSASGIQNPSICIALVTLFLFFLSTPIGLLVNGIGWLFLEKITDRLAFHILRLLEKYPYLICFLSKEELLWKFSLKSLSKDDYHYIISLARFYLDTERNGRHFRLDPARSGVKFIRGLVVLTLIFPFIYEDFSVFASLLLALFFLFITVGLKTYLHSEILQFALHYKYKDELQTELESLLKKVNRNIKSNDDRTVP